jgi:ribose 5-phosphate isomerase A
LKLTHKPNWIKKAKKTAAKAAVKHVKDGSIVGLGSGSTVAFAIEELGEKVKKEQLDIWGIPTSYQTFLLATKYGVKITTLEEHPYINLTIDGADQIDAQLNLIKGMGGALTREKIVAQASKINIIIADESKKVKNLGDYDHPVPIEVLPFALSLVKNQIRQVGGKPVLREGNGKVGPVITDNGNVILDAHFGLIKNPKQLNKSLKMITGVVETGLFIDSTDIVYIGKSNKTEKIERK